MILKRGSVMHLLAVFILIFGASVISAKPATALADQTVNCGSGGTFTIVSNVVTTSSLTCAGSVVIPTGVTSIAANAFSRSGSTSTEQSRITSVSISNTVTSVGNGAFWANSGVTSLTIGSSVSSIGRDAFRALSSITALVVPGSVRTIGAWAFADMGATTLTLNEGLETVGDAAFIGNRLITIVIPNSVTTISFEAAFAGYWVLENLTLGSGLTTIGGRAFDGSNNLKSLTIPRNVTSLGADAFRGYAKSTYTYCGTSLTQTALNNAGLTGKTNTLNCPIDQTINLTSTKSSMSYNETATLTTSGTSGSGAITYTVNSGCSVTGNILKATGASGNCTVSATIAADATYAAATSTTLTIPLSKAEQQSTMYASQVTSSATWNGSAYTATPTYSTGGSPGTGAVTYTVANGSATGCTLSNNSATAVLTASTSGTCVTTATKAATTNYEGASVTLSFTFNKATSSISLAISRSSATYGVTVYETATVTPSTATGTVSFSNNGTPITGCSSVNLVSGVAVCSTWKPSVGVYTPIAATYSGSAYHLTSTSTDTVSLEITKAPLLVIPDSKTVTVGASVPTYSFTYQGFVNSENASSSSFTTGLTEPVCTNAAYSTSTAFEASPLTISCTGGLATNYSFDTSATASLTISKATTTLSLALANATPTYGSVDTITATASVPGTVTFKSSGTNISGCENVTTSGSSTITALCAWIPGGIASYSLTAVLTPTNAAAFSGVTATALTPTSVKPAITVTPTAGQSKFYGANNPTLTYSITSGALVGSDLLTGALTYSGTLVGDYPITIGTLANSNYEITLASATFAITKATQTAVSLSSLSAAYNPSNKTVSLTGSGGDGTGTYQYALDVSNTTVGCSVSSSTLTYTTAGTCVVAVTRTLDSNYFARTDVVSFSIGLASQTITFGSLSAKSYSSETFTVSASSSALLTVVFTSGSSTICTTSGTSGSTITLLGVGTCVLNANQPGDANTAAASQVSQNFTVNPRAITVTADAKTKAYGSSDPTFTYTITTGSLILGDAITGALTRATGTDVGTYQIQQGGLTTANNPKYAITFVSADLTITRVTPTLVLTYPNSNVAILRPGATDTPTVTTSSSSGSLTFATTAASSICTVDSSSGVIALFGAGSCPVAMTTALTTNFIAHTETTTVTVALLSTSLVGIDTNDLVSMGQPFYAHASIDQFYSFSSGNNGASISIPAGALNSTVPISISLLTDSAEQRAMIGGTGTSVLSVVVSWVASDGSVPSTNAGKAISVTLTNPAIKSGAKIYSIIGNQSTLLGTSTADGSVTSLITDDPVLLVINPVVAPSAPSITSSSGAVDNSAAIAAANAKLEADKAAAELKAAQDKKAAEEAEAAALKAAKELADAQAQAAATLKAAEDKAAEELRIAEKLRLANLKAEEDLKIAAAKKAADDIAAAARAVKPAVTLYSVSPKLKLSAYDNAYLETYVKSLKNGAAVSCIGYTYTKNTTMKKATVLAKSQATAVCAQMKRINKTLKTSIVVYPSTKAPKAATGAKWVGVSYRIDGFKAS
jgi:hypothetical protein